MIDAAADLAAIYAGPEFALTFTRSRDGAADLDVRVIVGTVDEEALQGHIVARQCKVSFATGTDVRADDVLTAVDAVDAVDAVTPAGTRFVVLAEPKRINDGLECEALLGSAPT